MMGDTEFSNFGDDNSPYISADTINAVIKRLETVSVKLFKWFADKKMKTNQDKHHVIAGRNDNVQWILVFFKSKTAIVKIY